MSDLGWTLGEKGRCDEAAALQQETLEIQRRTLGPDHRDALITAIGLANSLGGLGKYDPAEKLLIETREIQRRLLGPDSPCTADTTWTWNLFVETRGLRRSLARPSSSAKSKLAC
jgi:eukaryotic-like serine/threonine-protein kinase